jgi:hypothetical protein
MGLPTIRRAMERIRVSLDASDGSGLLPRAPSNFAEGPLQFTHYIGTNS